MSDVSKFFSAVTAAAIFVGCSDPVTCDRGKFSCEALSSDSGGAASAADSGTFSKDAGKGSSAARDAGNRDAQAPGSELPEDDQSGASSADAATSTDAASKDDSQDVLSDAGQVRSDAGQVVPDAAGSASDSGQPVDAGKPTTTLPPACVPSVPAAEVCDGVDNNCDGTIDELFKNACGGPCMTAVPPEDCGTTSKDDDCDGEINEGCTPTCVPTVPSTEVCDGKDNDCDGRVDNGPAEVCDNRDNDCDGVVDNGATNVCGGPCSTIVPGREPGTPCTNGIAGACQTAGFYECGERAYTHCNAPLGNNKPEICDGLDNNCDTQVDNVGFGVGTTWRIDCPGGDSSVLYACTMPAVKPGCIVTAE